MTTTKQQSDPVLSRINRIEGQVKAVRKMYEAERACTEIVQQIQASRAALGTLASLLLTDEARKCAEEGNVKELEKIVEKTFKTI